MQFEPVSPEVLGRIEAYVQEQFRTAGMVGLAVAVVSDGETVFARGYGVTDRKSARPVTPDTAFEIGSITKSLTATAILQLRERGLLDLDDPVRRHLPWFQVGGAEPDRITIRQLLSHSSGLPTGLTFLVLEYPDSAEAAGRALAKERLQSQPGTKFAYANIGYTLLGLIVEAVSGRPWAEYVQQEILQPLGMASSAADYRTHPQLDLAAPHGWMFGFRAGTIGWLRKPAMAAAGSMTVCSIRDLARYAALDLGGYPGAVLRLESLAEAHTGLIETEEASRYGLGWVDRTGKGERVVWHNGGTEGSSSILMLVPERRLAVAVLANTSSSLTDQIGSGVLNILMGKEPDSLKGKPNLFRQISAFTGLLAALGIGLLSWLALTLSGEAGFSWVRLLIALPTAAALWYLVARFLPGHGALPPLRLFHRWPADLQVAVGSLLGAASLWAIYAVATLLL